MEENICNFFPRVQAWDLGARGTKNELFELEDMYKNKERVKSVTAHIEVDRVKPYVHVLLLLYILTISICRVLMAKTRGYKRVRGVIYSIPLFTGSYTSYTSCRISANNATLQPIFPFLCWVQPHVVQRLLHHLSHPQPPLKLPTIYALGIPVTSRSQIHVGHPL